MAEQILNLTLEIIYLLTGEEYKVVKKSGECVTTSSNSHVSGPWNKSQSPIVVPAAESLTHPRDKEQKILQLTSKITQMLTGEVPIRCQDVTVYLSMEEWEYLEGHKDQYKDMMENPQPPASQDVPCYSSYQIIVHLLTTYTMAEKILNLTLDIIYLKTAEEYMVVKKSGECVATSSNSHVSGELSKSQNPIMVPPAQSLIHPREKEQKILELTSKIIQMLNREVPIRCQDVTVYFSMEEWEYLEEHKDQYKDFMMKNHQPLTLQDVPLQLRCYIVLPPCEPGCNSDGEHFITPNLPSDTHRREISSDATTLKKPSTQSQVTKQFPCSECGKVFVSNSKLVTHQRKHTGERPFSCPECEKCFKSQRHLTDHLKNHIGEKPYSCPECGKCFSYKSSLFVHQRFHTGEKPYSCSECGKGFSYKSNLVVHQRFHTGERPYSCSECGKCFVQRSNFVFHQRTHTGEKPFSCPDCDKCFTRKRGLARHQKFHMGKKP